MDHSFPDTFAASNSCEKETKALIERIRVSVHDTNQQLKATHALLADSRTAIRDALRRLDTVAVREESGITRPDDRPTP